MAGPHAGRHPGVAHGDGRVGCHTAMSKIIRWQATDRTCETSSSLPKPGVKPNVLCQKRSRRADSHGLMREVRSAATLRITLKNRKRIIEFQFENVVHLTHSDGWRCLLDPERCSDSCMRHSPQSFFFVESSSFAWTITSEISSTELRLFMACSLNRSYASLSLT